jgi:hypothetical protein
MARKLTSPYCAKIALRVAAVRNSVPPMFRRTTVVGARNIVPITVFAKALLVVACASEAATTTTRLDFSSTARWMK